MTQAVLSNDRAAEVTPEEAARRAEIENFIIELWSALIPDRSIKRTDNFFDLGGVSIQALQFIAQVREFLGVSIKARAFFDAPVVSDVAQLILNQHTEQQA